MKSISRSVRSTGLVLSCTFMVIPQLAVCPQFWVLRNSRELEFGEDTDWCHNTDCGHEHTMCNYVSDTPSSDCQNFVKFNLTSRYQLMILHFLNYRRNLVAGGNEYKLPSATGMRMLQWDDTMARFAERWMYQCIYHPALFKHFRPQTDFCRDHPKYNVIQYGFVVLGNRTNEDWSMMDLITLLVDWISSDGDRVSNHVLYSGYIPFEDDGAVFFYAPGYKVGCAAAAFDVYSTNSTLYDRTASIICNLGPVENFYLQDRYYEAGPPCSSCPADSACDPKSNFMFLCQSSDSQLTYYDEAEDDDEESPRMIDEEESPYGSIDSFSSYFLWI